MKPLPVPYSPALAVLFLATICLSGCQPSSNENAVYPVRGKILVDGKPVEGLQIKLHSKKAVPQSLPTHTTGTTDAQGTLRLSTHSEGDGAPEGDYAFTIRWQEFSLAERTYAGPDKLKNKYAEPSDSSVQLSVGPGKSNDLGTVELTSQN